LQGMATLKRLDLAFQPFEKFLVCAK